MEPTARFYITGGTVPPGTPSYVERQTDKELLVGLDGSEFRDEITPVTHYWGRQRRSRESGQSLWY